MTGRERCLAEASEAVLGRGDDYGKPDDLFSAIAMRWSLTIGVPVTARQVAIMMIDLKVERAVSGSKRLDTAVDIAGYAACLYEIDAEGAS